jgi:hypothetical protein
METTIDVSNIVNDSNKNVFYMEDGSLYIPPTINSNPNYDFMGGEEYLLDLLSDMFFVPRGNGFKGLLKLFGVSNITNLVDKIFVPMGDEIPEIDEAKEQTELSLENVLMKCFDADSVEELFCIFEANTFAEVVNAVFMGGELFMEHFSSLAIEKYEDAIKHHEMKIQIQGVGPHRWDLLNAQLDFVLENNVEMVPAIQ